MRNQMSIVQRPYIGLLLSALLLVLTAGYITAFSATADEAKTIKDIAGRWVVTELWQGVRPKKGQIFDFVRCGDEWCGVEVKKDGKCSRTAFHISKSRARILHHLAYSTGSDELGGRYKPTENTRLLVLWGRIKRKGTKIKMILAGANELGKGAQRSYPFELELSRQGDAVCKTPTS
jgi:hypothetical protein